MAVWLSPQTRVMPGWVSPNSGLNTWTTPWWPLPGPKIGTPNSAQLVCSCATWRAAMGSAIGLERSVVGMLWSMVAMVRSGRRTLSPRWRSPSKAWGLVTSWISCRSTANRTGSSGRWATTWASQILS